jgi:hypothetical protein
VHIDPARARTTHSMMQPADQHGNEGNGMYEEEAYIGNEEGEIGDGKVLDDLDEGGAPDAARRTPLAEDARRPFRESKSLAQRPLLLPPLPLFHLADVTVCIAL